MWIMIPIKLRMKMDETFRLAVYSEWWSITQKRSITIHMKIDQHIQGTGNFSVETLQKSNQKVQEDEPRSLMRKTVSASNISKEVEQRKFKQRGQPLQQRQKIIWTWQRTRTWKWTRANKQCEKRGAKNNNDAWKTQWPQSNMDAENTYELQSIKC